MIKVAVFDIDGTLAQIGRPIKNSVLKQLKDLENRGVTIVLSSGKTVYYQMGMFRQAGLRKPVFIGENGCCAAIGINLPPETVTIIEPSDMFFKVKNRILSEVKELCGDGIWLQPNEIMLTFFFKDCHTAEKLRRYFSDNNFKDIDVYEHADSFDVVPANIDKFVGLGVLTEYLGFSPDETVTVGDGVNDLPMFKFGKYSVSINNKSLGAAHDFKSIDEALKFISGLV